MPLDQESCSCCSGRCVAHHVIERTSRFIQTCAGIHNTHTDTCIQYCSETLHQWYLARPRAMATGARNIWHSGARSVRRPLRAMDTIAQAEAIVESILWGNMMQPACGLDPERGTHAQRRPPRAHAGAACRHADRQRTTQQASHIVRLSR
jgi:hypothetical protein